MSAARPARFLLSCSSPPIVLFSAMLLALPVVGLAVGPLYAALVFGLGGLLALYTGLKDRCPPAIDRQFAALALVFVALCWASTLWSVVPATTMRAAGQITLILAGALITLSIPPLETGPGRALIRLMPWFIGAGVALLCLDTCLGYRIQGLAGLDGNKYSRGIDYLVLITWPVLAYTVAQRNWRATIAVAALIIIAVVVGLSTTGAVGLLMGVVLLGLAALLRNATAPCLFTVVAALVAALPFMLRLLSASREELRPYIKPSGLHRLEIWDYTSARILDQPIFGWGLLSAKSVPIRPEELATYRFVDIAGIYPHNQWLELWLETGAVGATLALIFLGLVLWRVWRKLPAETQPFAYAAIGSALTISWLNFEITTDSWWAALTASALLFKLVNALHPHQPDAACESSAS